MKNIILNSGLTIFVLLLFCYYIWFRFIRERLPRDIPFDLSLVTLIIIIFICGVFLYGITNIINPKSPNLLTQKFIMFYANFFIYLSKADQILKKNALIRNYIEFTLLFLIKKLTPFTLYSKGERIYMQCFLSSRILIVSIFIIDVLYFHKIQYTYNFILLGLIILFIAYIKYSLKIYTVNSLKLLDDYLIEITSEDNDLNTDYYLDPSTISYDVFVESEYDLVFKYLNIPHFIRLQSTAIMFDHTPYNYKCFHKSRRQDIINLNESKGIIFSENYIEKLLRSCLDIEIIFETLNFIEKRNLIKNLQIAIYSLYIISWSYILIVSLPYLHITALEEVFLNNFQDTIEPFSGLVLLF